VLLPANASLELGACLGVPFLTAHRCLTLGESMPDRLDQGALTGKTVLVQGGAGAVGNAAIQLAKWADARVITTVSSPEKAQLAAAAGADDIVNYRTQDVPAEVRKIVPHGVDAIVEVSVARNAEIDAQVIGMHGAVAIYADDGGASVTIPIRPMMGPNARWQFVLVYTEPSDAKGAAIEDINAAVADGAVRIGPGAGLPVHRFPLADAAKAHAAVEQRVTGKVLIDVADL
jgi:NADPH2:quinone reductase